MTFEVSARLQPFARCGALRIIFRARNVVVAIVLGVFARRQDKVRGRVLHPEFAVCLVGVIRQVIWL
jgi:hypothetical protein